MERVQVCTKTKITTRDYLRLRAYRGYNDNGEA